MRAAQIDPEQLRRIRQMAELLGGEELGEERGNALSEMAVNAACAFCSRCPYAMNICAEYEPEVTDLGNGHQVACWLNDPRADRSGVPFRTGGADHE